MQRKRQNRKKKLREEKENKRKAAALNEEDRHPDSPVGTGSTTGGDKLAPVGQTSVASSSSQDVHPAIPHERRTAPDPEDDEVQVADSDDEAGRLAATTQKQTTATHEDAPISPAEAEEATLQSELESDLQEGKSVSLVEPKAMASTARLTRGAGQAGSDTSETEDVEDPVLEIDHRGPILDSLEEALRSPDPRVLKPMIEEFMATHYRENPGLACEFLGEQLSSRLVADRSDIRLEAMPHWEQSIIFTTKNCPLHKSCVLHSSHHNGRQVV